MKIFDATLKALTILIAAGFLYIAIHFIDSYRNANRYIVTVTGGGVIRTDNYNGKIYYLDQEDDVLKWIPSK